MPLVDDRGASGTGRSDSEVLDVTEVGVAGNGARPVRCVQHEMFLAAFVTDDEQPLAIGQPRREALAYAAAGPDRTRRVLPQRKVEQLPASFQYDGTTVGVSGEVSQELCSGNEPAVALHARARRVDVDPPGRVVGRVEQPDVTGVLVDDPRAVGRRETRVVVGVVGVPSQICTRWPDRVEVADAFVVGDEVDAVADPQWMRDVGVDVREDAPERALAGPVYP